jgi:hypothetical protein
MGIPLTIFTLYRLDGDGAACPHHLLLRVRQAGYGNADEGEADHVFRAAEATRRALIRRYEAEVLAKECGAVHAARSVGELEAHPAGEALDGPGGYPVDLWIAQTRFGAPWVVLGTASDEAAFWRAVEEDDGLSGLGPIRPAARQRAFFITDEDGRRHPATAQEPPIS